MKSERAIGTATVALLTVLIWLMWPVNRAVLRRPLHPRVPESTLEFNFKKPGMEPVKITISVDAGETREEWERKLHTALERAEAIR